MLSSIPHPWFMFGHKPVSARDIKRELHLGRLRTKPAILGITPS